MNKADELKLRISAATDFLASIQQPDGTFISSFINGKPSSKPTKIMSHLDAIMLLDSCAKYLDKKNLQVAADKALSYVDAYCFKHDEKTSCLIFEEESHTYWNAQMSLIHLRRGDRKRSEEFINSVLPCILENKVVPKYEPGTSDDFIHRSSMPMAILVFPLLGLQLCQEAEHVGNLILQMKKFARLDPWALRVLFDCDTNKNEYRQRAFVSIQMVTRFSPLSMTSQVVSQAMQSCMSWYKYIPEWKELVSKLIDHQIGLQDLEKHGGAFAKSKQHPELYMEYIIYNVAAYLQYLQEVEGESVGDVII